ncbi:MAG: glycosyltransferase [Clostridiales bacterium]|nr:glycosyltransferase [Clostridiales bacterium]
MDKKSIIFFSSDEWESGLKTSQYHVAKHLSNYHFVLYVNSVGLRKPEVSKGDLFKIIRKLKSFFNGSREVKKNLVVVSPIVLPFHANKLAITVNKFIMWLFVEYYMLRLKLKRPVIFTFLPNTVEYLNLLRHEQVVYYCADQVSNFIGVDIETVIEQEKRLLKRCDLAFMTSMQLYNEKKLITDNAVYMPHGVDVELFNQAINNDLPIPDDMKSIKTPVIGFFGLVSNDWIDFELLGFVAKTHPEWSIVLLGKSETDIPDLKSFKNIYLLGSKPYEHLPEYCQCFDVGIIPFVISELSENCNPIKVKEYLAAGLPVVSTKIPELVHYGDIVNIANNYDEFVKYLESSIEDQQKHLSDIRSKYVEDETWDKKVHHIMDLLQCSNQ